MHARPGWLLLAAIAEGGSMAGLARQQRRLVGRVRRRPLRLRSVIATTYSGNAISVSLPLVGPGVSAAFTYRRYTSLGARPGQVATGLAVSGLLSLSAFVAVLATAAAASGQTALLAGGVTGLLASAVPVVGVLLVLHSVRLRRRVESVVVRTLSAVRRVVRRPAGDPKLLAAHALEQLAAAEFRRRDIAAAFALSLLNWAADVACLGLALAAVGATVSWPLLTLAWAAGAAVSSLNLTPGGVGVVEAAITEALTAAGLGTAAALPGVLLYRVLSFWVVLSIGWLLILVRHRLGRPVRTQ